MEIRKRPMQTAKFVVLFLIWSAKTKSSVTVKMLNSYKVVTKQKGVRIMRQYHETEKKEIQKLAKMYREFLDAGKTERECSSNICRIAKEQGFENLEDVIREGKQLKAGDKVQLVGFGTFEVSERAAREGRNPQTGKTMTIAACKAPKFKAGKALKDAIN